MYLLWYTNQVWYRQGTDHSCSWHGVNLVSRKSKRLESRVDCVFLPAAPCLAKRNECGNLPCSVEGVTSELD